METPRVQQPIPIQSSSGAVNVPIKSPPNSAPTESPSNAVRSLPNSALGQSPRRAARARNASSGAESPAGAQDQAHRKKVMVSGYPSFAQPQDLIYAFAKIGAARVESCSSNGAVLAFNTVEEAKAAVQASRRVFALGQLLVVRPGEAGAGPGAGGAGAQRAPPKRDFTRTKQKCVIIDPKKLNLSGDFHTQLDTLMDAVRLTQEDVSTLSGLYSDLEAALQAQWPGCTAIPFGSITTGLGIKTSDADCFMDIPRQFRQHNANHVYRAKRLLQQYPSVFAEILSIPRANTPIVKFFHIPTETNCDVSFKTPLGAQNSKLIAFLLHADPRLIPMAVAIKYWAKVHNLSGTGKLTNYALTMMMIFYLQQPPMSILPSVEWLQRDEANDYIVDGWNTGFQRTVLPPCSNTSSISELLGGFFEYYSMFNFDEMVVCPYLGVPLKKDAFRNPIDLPEEFERYKSNVLNDYVYPLRYGTSICVQDPFEQCHNVASSITSKLASDIKCYLQFAANAYEKEKLNNCEGFLKTILLEKPKIVRTKAHPEYRVNLFPRIINTIIEPEWKPIVRELLMTIFESMLKIKLGKVEEKVNPDSKKEKEKYSGTVTRAIWKRKQFTKLYNAMDLGFEKKQERITEEILSVDKQAIDLQFQLTLTYCHSPKSAAIVVRMGDGDVEAFREFGKFFISVLQNWFTVLLKPYARPNTKDTATKIAEAIDVLDSSVNDIETDDDEESQEILDGNGDVNVTINSDVENVTMTSNVGNVTMTSDVENVIMTSGVVENVTMTPGVENATSPSDGPKSTDDMEDIVTLTNNKCVILNVSSTEKESELNEICALVPPT